jgi:hypothetical protein
MLKSLFGSELGVINLKQAKYILNEQNWQKFNNYSEFKTDFEKNTQESGNLPLIRLKETTKNDNQSYCYLSIKREEEKFI